jgi:pilus assembly protein CpaC
MSRTGFWILLLSLPLATVAAKAQDEGPAPPQPAAPQRGAGSLGKAPGGGAASQTGGGAASQTQEAPRPATRSVIVNIGMTKPLQMTSKKQIKTVVNPSENIAVVTADERDPTKVNVTGKEAGTTRLTFTAVDNTEEVVEIVVQFDVEYLRSLLQRASPTSNLQLIPGAGGTVIIGGDVAHAEDIDIIMRAARSVLGSEEKIINAMRVGGVQQVQLDVVVAFVSRSELRRMSFDFLSAGDNHNFSSTVGGALINPMPGGTLPTTPGFALPITNIVPNAPNGAPANFFLGLFNNKQIFYGLLQALRNDNLAKILAEPRLVTLSGRSATLLSGGEQAIPETAGLGSVSVRFEPFGTKLSFLPIVLGNGRIHLEVEPEVSNLDAAVGTSIAGTVVPGRDVQRVHTTVVIEDGQTLAIGGLIQTQIMGVTTKVPVLGELPFIGAAFSSKSYNEIESELVVLVTPHLVDPMACNQLPKYVPGQETRSPDDFELFLEGIMEAPRGPREVFPNRHYVPAFQNGPTADIYPCAGGSCQAGGACGDGCGHRSTGATPVDQRTPTNGKAMTTAVPEGSVKPVDQAGGPRAPTVMPGVNPGAPAPVAPAAGSADAQPKDTKRFVLPSAGGAPGSNGDK